MAIGLDETAADSAFHQFSHLPTEIRLKIWRYSLPGPRIVPVCCNIKSPSIHHHSTTDDTIHTQCSTSCTTTTSLPTNLHICTESRAEAGKNYRRCFGFGRLPGHIYFDPARDILYFGPQKGYMAADAQFRTCMAMCDPCELASVRRLAVNDALFWIDDMYRSMAAANLTYDLVDIVSTRMPRLEELLFVPREEEEEEEEENEDRLQQNMSAVKQRIGQQISSAMFTLSQEHPERRLPTWRVATLQELRKTEG